MLFTPTVPAPQISSSSIIWKVLSCFSWCRLCRGTEWGPAVYTSGDIHLVREGKGCVSHLSRGCWAGPSACGLWAHKEPAEGSLCSCPYRCSMEQRSTCGSSACASEHDSSCLSKRVTNALWHLVPESFPHEVCQLPCISCIIISWSLGMHVSLEGRSRGFFFNEGFFSLS